MFDFDSVNESNRRKKIETNDYTFLVADVNERLTKITEIPKKKREIFLWFLCFYLNVIGSNVAVQSKISAKVYEF